MEKKKKLLALPVDIIHRVKEYQHENRMDHFVDAVKELIEKGLNTNG